MNNQELYRLFKNSRVAQVAKPMLKSIRGNAAVPTHQVIYTPKGSAVRLDFGLKSTLPKQIGYSHIAFNDIDNYKNMPDVEKYTGKMYNRLKYQEIGVAVKPSPAHALFPTTTTKRQQSDLEVMTELFNLSMSTSPQELAKVLSRNKNIHIKFQRWLCDKHPEVLLEKRLDSDLKTLVKQFLNDNASNLSKKETVLGDFVKNDRSQRTTQARYTDKPCVQGNAGFSYLQPGRLANTPNGVRYGSIAPGRIVGQREAAIGGVVASVQDTSIRQQTNYTQHQGGRTTRQFNMPFRVGAVLLSNNGAVNVSASGVEAGSWMKNSVLESPGNFRKTPRINETKQDDDLNTLFNILRV